MFLHIGQISLIECWYFDFQINIRLCRRCVKKIIIIVKKRKTLDDIAVTISTHFIDNRRSHPSIRRSHSSIISFFHLCKISSRNWSSYRFRWHIQEERQTNRMFFWCIYVPGHHARMPFVSRAPRLRRHCRGGVNKRENKRLTRQRLTPTMGWSGPSRQHEFFSSRSS